MFDLDGTLSDPLQGIGRSMNYALTRCGFEPVDAQRVASFIGPPLDEAFETLVGSDSTDLIDRLVEAYRERYSEIGYTENRLYPGVAETLRGLHELGIPLAVCTSKRTDFAERILRMFELVDLFRFIDGGEIRNPKWQQIGRLCSEGRIPQRSLMIGDRAVDLVAAHSNGLESAGVLWGYGSRTELEAEGPRYLFGSPLEWLTLAGGQPGFHRPGILEPQERTGEKE